MKGCRPLTDQEVDLIAKSFGGQSAARDRTLFLLGIKSGRRISQLLSLQVGDLVDSRGQIVDRVWFRRRDVKGKIEGQAVLIHPDAKAALVKWIADLQAAGYRTADAFVFQSKKGRNRPISRKSAWRILKDAFEANELAGKLGTHSMRKTFADRINRKAEEMRRDGKDVDPLILTQRRLAIGTSIRLYPICRSAKNRSMKPFWLYRAPDKCLEKKLRTAQKLATEATDKKIAFKRECQKQTDREFNRCNSFVKSHLVECGKALFGRRAIFFRAFQVMTWEQRCWTLSGVNNPKGEIGVHLYARHIPQQEDKTTGMEWAQRYLCFKISSYCEPTTWDSDSFDDILVDVNEKELVEALERGINEHYLKKTIPPSEGALN